MKRWIRRPEGDLRTVFVCNYVRDEDGNKVEREFVFKDKEEEARRYLVSRRNARPSNYSYYRWPIVH